MSTEGRDKVKGVQHDNVGSRRDLDEGMREEVLPAGRTMRACPQVMTEAKKKIRSNQI